MRQLALLPALALLLAAAGCEHTAANSPEERGVVRAYVVHHGSDAFRRIKREFEDETGAEVSYIFACRTAMAKIVADSQDGDVCVTSGWENIRWFGEHGLATGEPVAVAELIPVVEVARGNPKRIACVADLARPDVRVALGKEKGCLGAVAETLLEKHGLTGEKAPHVVQRTSGEHNVAATVDGEKVDATIVWSSTVQSFDPEGYDTVAIPVEDNAIDPVGAVVLNTGSNAAGARAFVTFLQSDKARGIFREARMLRDQ